MPLEKKPSEEPMIRRLAAVLQNGDEMQRMGAAWALGKTGHESAVPLLARALKDKERDVRTDAALSLLRIGRAIQEKPVEGSEAKALQVIFPHIREGDELEVIAKALEYAFKGKITGENAKLTVKQLRALKGKLK